MMLAFVTTMVFLQLLIWWSSWYRKRYWWWTDCSSCGRMIELHRERHVVHDRHPIWKGQCDSCYNQMVIFITEN